MKQWSIEFVDAFLAEFEEYSEQVQNELLALLLLLEEEGPSLGRPHADTLNGSRHSNMKELRFRADDGVWRVAFAFDPRRTGIVLTGGNKSGVNEKRFYKELIRKADARFDEHLKKLREEEQ